MTRHYQCPGCGSTVEYDPSLGKLFCPYCNETYTLEEHHMLYPDIEGEDTEGSEAILRDFPEKKKTARVKILQCCSCGAEMMMNDVEISSFCAYCGQATVVTERLVDYLEPDYIIPFKVSKERAEEIIRKRISRGSFIPKEIKDFEVERLRGIYIPYWLFNISYSDEQVWWYKSGRYDYYCYRYGQCKLSKFTVEASERFNDEYSEKLEPYNANALEKFDATYLSGFYSDSFDVNRITARRLAEKRVQELYNREIEKTIRGSRKKVVHSNPRIECYDPKYALLPTWFLTFRYQDHPYTILVNGQTEKMVGAVPFVKRRAAVVFAVLAALLCPLLSVAFAYANHIVGRVVANPGGNGQGAGKLVAYYVLLIIVLFSMTWIFAVKRYRHMKRCVGLTKASETEEFVKERQDR